MFKDIPPPTLLDPNSTNIYVIGDLMGDIGLLNKMIHLIYNNPSNLPVAGNDKIVIMGNFLNFKRASTYYTIQVLRELKELLGDNLVIIRGAREQVYLKGKQNFIHSAFGQATINSYRIGTGLDAHNKSDLGQEKIRCGVNLKQYVSDHAWVLKNTQHFLELDNYFICSSGVDGEKTLDQQNLSQLMFADETAMGNLSKITKTVVHGRANVPVRGKVEITKKRINVNTNCESTGVLSCVILDDMKGELEDTLRVTRTKEKDAA